MKGDANLRVPIQGALPYVSSFSSFFAFPFLWSSTWRRDPAHGFSSSTSVATDYNFNLQQTKNPKTSFANLELGGSCLSSSGCRPKHCTKQFELLYNIWNKCNLWWYNAWQESYLPSAFSNSGSATCLRPAASATCASWCWFSQLLFLISIFLYGSTSKSNTISEQYGNMEGNRCEKNQNKW